MKWFWITCFFLLIIALGFVTNPACNSGWKLCTLRDPLTPSPGRKGKTYWSGYMYNNEDQYPYNSFEAHLVK